MVVLPEKTHPFSGLRDFIYWDVVEQLLDHGASAHRSHHEGNLLIMACDDGMKEMALRLLGLNVATNKADDKGYLPLHSACCKPDLFSVVTAIVEKYPQYLNRRTADGYTPLC